KKTPAVIDAIEILLEHDTAGDPITGIRLTHKTTAGIAELLRQLDIEISANTVARLLRDMDFSLRVNRKAIATDSSPDRDQQFRYISSRDQRAHGERRHRDRCLYCHTRQSVRFRWSGAAPDPDGFDEARRAKGRGRRGRSLTGPAV